MRHDEPELLRLRADLASARFEFALVKASWLETKRQAAAAIEHGARRANFKGRLQAEIEVNSAMLFEWLGVVSLRPADIPSAEDAQQETMAEWDRREATLIEEWSDDSARAAAALRITEDVLARRFAGRINAERQQALGVNQYVWRSRDDALVRDLHVDHDDKIFFWDEPPEGGHPGEAWNCRCFAEPFVADEVEWRPTIDAGFDRAIFDANLEGARDGALDFLSDLVPSLDDLRALLDAIGALAETGSAAAELAYLVVKEQALGLDDRERARRDALRGDAQSWVDDLVASLGDAPDLARALFEYVRVVEARPEALEEAHHNGLATQADAEAAYLERARMRTLAALYGLSAVLSGGAAARGLIKRLLRRPDGLSDNAAADDLAALARRTRRFSPDDGWSRVPNPGIVWG